MPPFPPCTYEQIPVLLINGQRPSATLSSLSWFVFHGSVLKHSEPCNDIYGCFTEKLNDLFTLKGIQVPARNDSADKDTKKILLT